MAQRSRKGGGQDEPDSTQTREVPGVSGDNYVAQAAASMRFQLLHLLQRLHIIEQLTHMVIVQCHALAASFELHAACAGCVLRWQLLEP